MFHDYTHQYFGHDYQFTPRHVTQPENLGLRGSLFGWSTEPIKSGDIFKLGKGVMEVPTHYVVLDIANVKMSAGVYQFVAEVQWIADEQVAASLAGGVQSESEYFRQRQGEIVPTDIEQSILPVLNEHGLDARIG